MARGRTRLPHRINYKMFQETPNHAFPFHIAGNRDERIYLIGLSEENARKIYEVLGKKFANETQSV